MKTIFILLLFSPLAALAQVELSLQACRDMALQNSCEMGIAGKQYEKAGYELRALRANFLPNLSVTGVGLYNRKKYDYKLKGGYLPAYKPGADGRLEPDLMLDPATGQPVIGADGNPVFNQYAFLPDIRLEISMRGVYSAGVQLEQPLYMGGKVRTAFKMAKTGEEIAGENIRMSRSQVIVEADQAYWQLLRVEEQVLAAAKYCDVVKSLLKNLENAQTVGMATGNDVLKARVRLNDAKLMLQKATNGRTLAQMDLCRLLGLGLYTALRLQDTLSGTLSPALWQLDTAISRRPDYMMLSGEVELKERQVALIRSDFLPSLGVTAGYSYGGGLKLNGDDEASATFSALAAVKIPVFHWGEGRNKVRSARMDEEISRLDLERSAGLMRLEIASARFNLLDARTRVEMSRDALSQAKENLSTSENQYRVGMESLTALLEAQAQWQEAWSQWIDAKARLHLYETHYLKAIGQLGAE